MKQKAILISCLLLIFLTTSIFAQPKFEKKEVEKTPAVQFINRSSKRMHPANRNKEIEQGKALAKEVAVNKTADKNGIRIKRVFDPKTKGIGADIVSINAKSNFGHINRIHRILTGYLISVFQYDNNQAEILAKFILYYNATHRQKMDKIKKTYSKAVATTVDPKKVGIERSWRKWAGKTQIIIPLKKNLARPGKTDINKDEIKDNKKATNKDKEKIDKVIDETRKEDKKVIDNKIEESEKKKKDINKKIQELQKDPIKNKKQIKKQKEIKKEVEKETKALKEQKKEIIQEEKKSEEAKSDSDASPDSSGDSTDSGNSADSKGSSADATDSKDTSTADKKTEETANTKKEETKADTVPTKKEEETSKNVVENKILFMRVLKYQAGGHYNNQLWWIETNKDDALSRSPYTNICSKGFLVIPGKGVLVIGYTGSGHDPKAHQLVLLDAKKLTKITQSKESIHWRSPLEFRDGKIYGIMIDNGSQYIARFNTDLTLDAKGTEAINPNSDITFTPKKIYVTGSPMEGQATTIRVFNRENLKHLKTIDSGKLN